MSNPANASSANVRSHRLQLGKVELVGGYRDVPFKAGFNIIQGHITTGKTTLVRLIRSLLATMPDDLPPEVERLSAIRGRVELGNSVWLISRPRTTTARALVSIVDDSFARSDDGLVLQLPVSGPGGNYSTFLLDQLKLPAVSVPAARTRPTESLTPVTMTDWLGYCIVPGDELDTQVFGHQHPFRDGKRRWVFQLAYGYYDAEVANLAALLRSIELRMESLDREAEVREKFFADTPFADGSELERQLEIRRDELEDVRLRRLGLAADADGVPGVRVLRSELLELRTQLANISEALALLQEQIAELGDLRRQLGSQSARITRAVVAGDWLVDFDFVVCPRCGTEVRRDRAELDDCYLCLQLPSPTATTDELLAEQSRIKAQIAETEALSEAREAERTRLSADYRRAQGRVADLSARLDQAADRFVSDRAARLEELSAAEARIEADIRRLQEYLVLVSRHEDQVAARLRLEEERDDVAQAIDRRELSRVNADANVRALERRMFEYLSALHIPELGRALTVSISPNTYLPVISGRSFDRLSSQGLKTLVNVAHALAHHTVAIDRALPMPGLLILDGLSANVGSEGFDQDRVSDMYRLLVREAEAYRNELQIVAVDNELPQRMFIELTNYVVLTLTQRDRLIRSSPVE